MKNIKLRDLTVFFIMGITFASKVLGFGREIILAHFYGASIVTDAYIVSINIPVSLFAVFSASAISGYIPLYNKISISNNENRAKTFTSGLINILLFFSVLIVCLTEFFTGRIINVVAPGLTDEALILCIKFTKISIFILFFFSTYTLLNEYLRNKGEYIYTVLVGLVFNIVMIVAILVSSMTQYTELLVIASLVAYFFQLILVIPRIRSHGYKYTLCNQDASPYIKEIIVLSIPIIIGTSINEINVMIDQALASLFSSGSISILNYANKMTLAIEGVFVTSLTSTFFPSLSKDVEKNGNKNIADMVNFILKELLLIIVPILICLFLFSKDLVRIFFGHGAFAGEDNIIMAGKCLLFYSVGMIGVALKDTCSKTFYALHNTKIPMECAVIGLLINIILNITLSKIFGISGLAIATSVSAIIIGILLYIRLGTSGYIKRSLPLKDLNDYIRIIISAFIAGLSGTVLKKYFNASSLFGILGSVIIILFIYILSLGIARFDFKTILEGNRRI